MYSFCFNQVLMAFCSPYPDPVCYILTGHQGLQVVPAHVVWRSLVDLLRHSLQQAYWNISKTEIGGKKTNAQVIFNVLFGKYSK